MKAGGIDSVAVCNKAAAMTVCAYKVKGARGVKPDLAIVGRVSERDQRAHGAAGLFRSFLQ